MAAANCEGQIWCETVSDSFFSFCIPLDERCSALSEVQLVLAIDPYSGLPAKTSVDGCYHDWKVLEEIWHQIPIAAENFHYVNSIYFAEQNQCGKTFLIGYVTFDDCCLDSRRPV